MKKILIVSSFVALAFSQGAISATSPAVPLTVTATVLSSCAVTAGGLLTFLAFAPDAVSEPSAQVNVSVLCTATNTPYNVLISKGGGATATVASREMRVVGVGAPLKYSLYQDAAKTLIWGDTVGTDTVTGSGGLLPTTHTVYSKIFSGQSVPTGVYTDIVMVSVVY